MAAPDNPKQNPPSWTELPALALLFARGRRPDRASLAAWATGGADPFELVGLGQRFALTGLAPGAAASVPAGEHWYGFAARPQLDVAEAMVLHPAQRAGRGDGLLPVVRALTHLGGKLCGLPDLLALCWLPAATVMAPHHFRRLGSNWLEGGPFLALGLTALDVGEGAVRSRGLALFTGFELQLDGAGSDAANARLALRAIHVLVEGIASVYDGSLVEVLGQLVGKEIRCEMAADGRLLLIRQGRRGMR